MDSDIQGLPGPDLGDIDDVHFMSFLQEIAHEDEPGIGDLNFLGPAVSEAAIPLPASAPNYGCSGPFTDPIESHRLPTTTLATTSNEQDEQSPADAPEPAATGPKPTLTKKQLQLEKLRAKNRRSQARYREKCKKEREALEAKIAAVQKSIHESGANYKRMRQERSALLNRIKNANAAQVEPSVPQHPQIPHVHKGTKPAQASTAHPAHSYHPGPSDIRCAQNSMVPTRIGRQKFFDSFDEVPWPISSFRHHASISFPEVAPFMPRSQLWYRDHNNGIYAAISGFLHSVCSDLGRHVSEICWFNQLPFQINPGLQLSHSHEQLQAATDPNYHPPEHPELDAALKEHSSMLSDLRLSAPPSTPSTTARVRCGVNDSRPLQEVVEGTLKPVLREYRRRLPREKWTAVCVKAMLIVQQAIDSMQAPTASDQSKDPSQPSDSDSATADSDPAKSAQAGQQPAQQKGQDPSSAVNPFNHDNTENDGDEDDEEDDTLPPKKTNCVAALLHHAQRQANNSISAHISDVGELATEDPESCKQCGITDSLPISLESIDAGVDAGMGGIPSGGASTGDANFTRIVTDQMPSASDTGYLPSADDGYQVATESSAMLPNAQQAMKWEELDKNMLVLMQCVFRTYASVLHESPAHASEAEASGRTIDQIHGRMMELMASAGIACRMMHETAPVTARRMCLGNKPASCTNVQAERMQMKVFSYLEFTPQQKSELAEKWRGWHRRRYALDRQLTTAMTTFNTALPSPSLVPKQFEKLLDSVLDPTPYGNAEHSRSTECPDGPDLKDAPSVGVGDLHVNTNDVSNAQVPSCGVHPEADEHVGSKQQHAQVEVEPSRTYTAPDLGDSHFGSLHAASEDTASDPDKDPGMVMVLAMGEMLALQSMHTRRAFKSIDPFLIEQDGGQQADCNPYGVPQSSVDDTKPGWSPSDSMLAEAAENLSRLLGVNGEETRKCEDALEQVVDVHRSDGKMYHEYVSHVAMPSWLLTEVQHCKLMAAHTEIGVSVIDMFRLFKAAAHEERWEALFGGFRV